RRGRCSTPSRSRSSAPSATPIPSLPEPTACSRSRSPAPPASRTRRSPGAATSSKRIAARNWPMSSSTSSSARAEVTEPVIAVSRRTKRFGSVLAVDDLDFSVGRGDVCGLLGPNGAGKTTTLRVLVGLVFADAGEAQLFGRRVRPGDSALSRVGIMIEESAFVPYLSGDRNLRLWWEAGGAGWADADVETALAVAGLGDAIGRKVKTYSQGMKQRLGLARALLSRPDVLVLDEPTSGLDPGEMREVRQLLRRVSEQGATVLLSSHLLTEVEQVCSHAVVMD